MENEEITQVNEQEQDYIQAINDLKSNTVSKDEYDKLRLENKKLLNSLVNGEKLEASSKKPATDINQLRKELFSPDSELTNLDYITKALELRTALIESGKPDPFIPQGKNITATEEDIAAANRVANVLQECVDYAAGDSNIFTDEIQRRTVDVYIPRR